MISFKDILYTAKLCTLIAFALAFIGIVTANYDIVLMGLVFLGSWGVVFIIWLCDRDIKRKSQQ
jgi:hypothetical protein